VGNVSGDPKAEPQRPTSGDNRDAWSAYWTARGMPWRTEPEVDEERQSYLTRRRAVKPDIEQGIYPFRDERGSIRLTRADVEWLLETHESGGVRGPVRWDDAKQQHRQGLDVRGAHLGGADISALPLACTRAALTEAEARVATSQQVRLAAVHLEQANLRTAQLQGALLAWGRLDAADLTDADLTGADLFAAHLEGANLTAVQLSGANLENAFFDASTYLSHTRVSTRDHGGFVVADVRWAGVNLTRVEWAPLRALGDERRAHQRHTPEGRAKTRQEQLTDFQGAVRASLQLALALRSQGLSELADRFTYRAHVCQRVVARRQRQYLRYAGSLLLWLVAGYGYKPLRSLLTYLAVVTGFAVAYFLLGPAAGVRFLPLDAAVFSITSFHGRGFMPGEAFTLHSVIAVLAALEAVLGLLIEITFIATFTQRVFAR
jgi:uncharacterized protein YjbI with pentapeptide repeats